MQLSADTRGVSPPTSELDRLLDDRAQALDLLTRAVDMIAEANALTPDPDGRDGVRQLKTGLVAELRNPSWYGIEKTDARERLVRDCMQHFDRKGWMLLLKRSQMTDLMSHQDKDAYYQQLTDTPPELNRESVVGTFTALFGNRHETWRRGVVELFAGLSGHYKSHDPFKVGRRLVIPNALGWSGWNFYTHADDKVDDLQRVIHVLQGEEPPATDDLWSRIITRERQRGAKLWLAGPVTVKWFKNQSVHIWINEPELIDRINEIIAEYYGATLANGSTKS